MQAGEVLDAAYRALLRRAPDAGGLAHYVAQVEGGRPILSILQEMVASAEARGLRRRDAMAEMFPDAPLPDLRVDAPERYGRSAHGAVYLDATDPAALDWVEAEILRHGYYDRPGVWGAEVDQDKQVTAALAGALAGPGGRVLEIGCFSGPVLGVLVTRGHAVTGLDLSHLAFVLAQPAVRGTMVFGDLLTAPLDGPFDAIVAMDVFEHLNPNRLPAYVRRTAELLATRGRVLVNSPMFGPDVRFGEVFEPWPEWTAAGDARFWTQVHCDDAGWPVHGHLALGSPARWEALFADAGLVRDVSTEVALLDRLRGFHAVATGRRSTFVLMRAGSLPRDDLPDLLAAGVAGVLGPG